ncbi:FkbM family methyltransferase [Sinorhizobium sp. M4_45]|uniref:FkbM family methyltransferase n=1 Tax=Sinorhizobium sp. M4_45 TaxID=2037901 RepID=UPI000C9ADFC8|nr:FkbM family methyltransferase [Sinorhizobium sp. M4_45]PND29543.1 hypothetical protein CN933_03165 [Sinorhizobium sp. M4_45]
MKLSDHHLQEALGINAYFVHRDRFGDLFEEITFAIYTAVLGNGDCAVDCGVNKGDHTRALMRACGLNGHVFAFEAAPQMMEIAKKNNPLRETISFIDKAVWHRSEEVMTFNFYPLEHGLSSLAVRAQGSEHIPIEVTTTTLDDAVDRHVSLIKLDIEGAEYHALKGAERIMTEDRPVIVFENGRQTSAELFGYTQDEFFELFHSRGYFLYTIAGMPFTPDMWDTTMPWQFLALHPLSPRTPKVFHACQAFHMRLFSNHR